MTAEAAAPSAPAPAPRGPLREFWEYFSANRGAVAGLVFVVVILLTAAFANVLAPFPPDLTNNAVFLKPPAWQAGGSWAYPLGTDALGHHDFSTMPLRIEAGQPLGERRRRFLHRSDHNAVLLHRDSHTLICMKPCLTRHGGRQANA